MHKVVWLLLSICVALASSAGPENHRPAHRPRLSSRLIPSRTTSTTPKPSSSTTLAPTTPSPPTTPAPSDEEQKEVAELSAQVLAQKHQEELALNSLKPTPTPAYPNINQFHGIPQSDIQQLLALMKAHQSSPTNYPTFPPPTINFSPSAPGSFYGQQQGGGYQNIFNQGSDPYSQYQSSVQYPQVYNAQGQYNLPPITQLPYNPPPTPNFVFRDGQYQVQAPNGEFQPIQFTTTTPVLPSFLTNIPAGHAPANTATANTAPANTALANTAPANTATANTALSSHAPANPAPEAAGKSEPETGVQYVSAAPQAVLPQSAQIYQQQSYPQQSYTVTQNGQTYTVPASGQSYAVPQNIQSYSVPQNGQSYSVPPSGQSYSVSQNSQGYSVPPNGQGYAVPQNGQVYSVQQHAQSYPVQQSYSVQQNGQSYSIPQDGQNFAGPQSGQSYSVPQNGQSYSVPQNGQGYPTQQSYPVQQNSQPTFTIQQSHSQQIYPVQNQQSYDGQIQPGQVTSPAGQSYSVQHQQQQYVPTSSQPAYGQQSTPLIHHLPVQQVTGSPQPSQGTHPFFQEQVVQSVTQVIDTPRKSVKQHIKG